MKDRPQAKVLPPCLVVLFVAGFPRVSQQGQQRVTLWFHRDSPAGTGRQGLLTLHFCYFDKRSPCSLPLHHVDEQSHSGT